MDQTRALVSPLTSVAVVCRECVGGRLTAMPHVVSCISCFADISVWVEFEDPDCVDSLQLLYRSCACETMAYAPPLPEMDRRKRFNRAMKLAAAAGNLDMVKWFAEVYSPGARVTGVATVAAENGHLHVLQWLVDVYGTDGISMDALELAYHGRHVEVAEWICTRWPSQPSIAEAWRDYQMHKRLIGRLSLPFLQWTVERGWMRDRSALSLAAKRHRMDFIEWLAGRLDQRYRDMKARHDRGDCGCAQVGLGSHDPSQELVPKCVNDGVDDDVGMTSGVEANRGTSGGNDDTSGAWFPHVFDLTHVATEEDADIVEWVRAANFPWLEFKTSSEVMDMVAASGRYELVVWLNTHASDGFTTKAMDWAAKHGHLKVVQFLHENRAEGCTTKAMDYAAGNGHLDVVQFLHEHRTEGYTRDASQDAARRGHLEVIKWLSANRSEFFTTREMVYAATDRRLNVVKWLHENRSEGCRGYVVQRIAERGDFEMLRYLVLGQITLRGSHSADDRLLKPMERVCREYCQRISGASRPSARLEC